MQLVTRLLALLAIAWAMAAPSAQGQPTQSALAVLVQPAETRPLAGQREFIGRAQAVDKVDLRARVQGFLGSRKFSDGDLVKEGQLLFLIEPEPYQAVVEQREGQRSAAAAALINSELQFKRAEELARTKVGTEAVRDTRLADLEQAKGVVLDHLRQVSVESRTDPMEVKEEVRKALKRFFARTLERRPVIVPFVVEM